MGNNISGIMFLISNSICSLLVYRKVIDFLILMCIFKSVYKLLISFRSFLSIFFLIFYIDDHVICGLRGHLCLMPDFSGKASSFSPLNMVLAVGFL